MTMIGRMEPFPTAAAPKSSGRRDCSTIHVDLAQEGSAAALESLLGTKRCKLRVKTAFVHTKSCIWYGTPCVDVARLLHFFDSLGKLPNLQRVTVSLDYLVLPVRALTALLSGAQNLNELSLCELILQGTDDEFQQLKSVLKDHTKLSSIALVRCHDGSAPLQRILSSLPALERVTLIGTKVAAALDDGSDDFGTQLVDLLFQSPTLKVLELEDNPNLQDSDLVTLCDYLSSRHVESHLQELNLSSSILEGNVTGEAILEMLETNQTIQKLSLSLGGRQWDNCGSQTASMLRANSSLSSLKLGVFGGTSDCVIRRARTIIKALADESNPKSQLKRLQLHLDVDFILDGPVLVAKLWKTLEQVMETNARIKEFVLLDDCREVFELPEPIQAKLRQNRSGIPRLLHKTNSNSAKYNAAYAKAIMDNKENLDLVFYALVENPSCLLAHLESSAESTSDNQTMSMVENPASAKWSHMLGRHPFQDMFERTRHGFHRQHSSDSSKASSTKSSGIKHHRIFRSLASPLKMPLMPRRGRAQAA